MVAGGHFGLGKWLVSVFFFCYFQPISAFLLTRQPDVGSWGRHRIDVLNSPGSAISSIRASSTRSAARNTVGVLALERGGADADSAPARPLPTAVVIVPGYASDASQYKKLQASFLSRGVACWVVPLKWYMWAPTFGGRSIRPILDRLHDTVLNVALQARPLPPQDSEQATAVQQYGFSEFSKEMLDPSQGACPNVSASFPPANAGLDGEGAKRFRVALVGHSAGGWVSRIYLSEARYNGMVYNGSRLVDTLVTLGSPHVFPTRLSDAPSVPYALRSLKFVDEQCRGWEPRVRCLCVGSNSVRGGALLGGKVKDMASSSYELCGYEELGVLGDGITPLESALGLPGASCLTLQGVMHGPEAEEQGRLWYGSDPGPIEAWLPFITQTQGQQQQQAEEEEEEEEEPAALQPKTSVAAAPGD